MLYVLHGSDTDKTRQRAQTLVAALQKKRPGALVFTFDDDSFEEERFLELIDAQGLFVVRHIVVLRKLLAGAYKEFVLEKTPSFASSENVFIVVEETLDKKALPLLEKYAEKVEVSHAKEQGRAATSFNLFVLGDHLGKRVRQALWLDYIRALHTGHVAEELHGTLFWAVKSMLLAARCATPEEAGLKPFVFSKFKRYASNYSSGELNALADNLVAIYHNSRRGKHELDVALEQFVLSV